MSKRSSQPEKEDSDALPPIPDGGLSSGMPDWLRRPPAWRGLQESAAPAKVVPPPDASPIDPRTILTVEDLPNWLQRIAARSPEQPSDEVAPDSAGENVMPHQPDTVVPISESVGEPSVRPGAPFPFGVGGSSDDPVPLTMTPARPSMVSRLFPSGTRAALLVALVLLVLLVIVLYATIVV